MERVLLLYLHITEKGENREKDVVSMQPSCCYRIEADVLFCCGWTSEI